MAFTISLLIYISLQDLRTHIISNRSLILLSISLYLTLDREIHLVYGLLALFIFAALGLVVSIGGGDIKLIVVLLLFGDVAISIDRYLAISMAVGCSHLLMSYLRNRNFSGYLALAPTICMPMLLSLALR